MIAEDGLVHVYGSGHSRMAVEEIFPRYGSFPGFHPIVELSMTFHNQVVGANGQRQAMFIENVEGLAKQIIKNFIFRENDVFMLFSTSGVGSVVVEMAREAKKMCKKVIVVTSVENCELSEAKYSRGKKLIDYADIVINTHVPIGDAAVKIDNLMYHVSPVSTIANTLVVNLIKARVAELLTLKGKPPYVLSSALVVGKEASQESFEKAYNDYRRRVNRSE